MKRPLPWLILWGAFWLLIIGLAPVLPGPKFFPPSWQTLHEWMPDWLDWTWPALFGASAVALVFGAFKPRGLILGYVIGAVAFIIWGGMSITVWLTNAGGSLPGSAVYFYVAGTMLGLAHDTYRTERIQTKVSEIEESVNPVLLERVTAGHE